jgi:hypothetical protein
VVNVLRLVEFSNRKTIDILGGLEEMAVAGDVVGVAVCYKMRDGSENVVFTGPYKRPDAAAGAAMRISWKMTQLYESPFVPPGSS